jgi:hypothetical protein
MPWGRKVKNRDLLVSAAPACHAWTLTASHKAKTLRPSQVMSHDTSNARGAPRLPFDSRAIELELSSVTMDIIRVRMSMLERCIASSSMASREGCVYSPSCNSFQVSSATVLRWLCGCVSYRKTAKEQVPTQIPFPFCIPKG